MKRELIRNNKKIWKSKRENGYELSVLRADLMTWKKVLIVRGKKTHRW
jgi:hypothetical protein